MKKLCIASLLLASLSASAWADVQVVAPWVRATVPQQRATGAFMTLTSSQDARLLSASSPAAAVVEIHEMKMDHNIMRMRSVEAVELPAGTSVEFKPGGYHIMLLDLAAPLTEGGRVPLALTVESADGRRTTLNVEAEVRSLTHSVSKGAATGHHH